MRKLVVWTAIVFGVYAAVQCGEYSTVDLARQRSREAMLLGAIDSLQREIDSLRRLRQLIRSDAATQERIAREAFGMVKGDRELLYRFVDPESLKARNP
jgi:cell division protein FtsB